MTSRASRIQRKTSTGRRRSAAARDRSAPIAALQAGLDRLPVGFALFDAKRELLAWNSILGSICGYPNSLLAAGTPVEAFLRHHAERGDYGRGDTNALVRERLQMLRRKSPQRTEQRLADGQLVRITSMAVPPRGLLVTCEDVTDARLAEQRYDIASRAINEGIYDWDIATGAIYFSERVYNALGLSRDDFRTGADWRGRIHPDDVPRFDAALVAHFKGRTDRFECDYRFRGRDGSWRWARQHGIALRDARGQATRLIGSTGDINELKLAEQALRDAHEETRQALERQTATTEILHVIASSPTDVHPVLDAVAARAARLCDARDAIILLREGDAMRFATHYGPIPNRPVGATRRLSPDTASGRSILEGRQIHIRDLQAETAEYPEGSAYAREFGYHTSLVTPLMREGAAIGTILVRRAEVRPFDERHMALIRTFADQAVIAIENVRLFNETKEALERQTATAEILKVIASSPSDVQPVFDAIVGSCQRLFDGQNVGLTLVSGGNIVPQAVVGDLHLKDLPPWPLDRGSATGACVLDGETINIGDVLLTVDTYPRMKDLSIRLGYRSGLWVPLRREGKVIGTINIVRRPPGTFTNRQVSLAETFAAQAVIAIENVRLFNETREALERQTATAAVLRVISASPNDLAPVFAEILDHARRLCEAEFGFVFTSDGQAFDPVAQRGLDAGKFAAWSAAFRLHRTPGPLSGLGRILSTKAPVSIADIADDEAYRARDPLRVLTVELIGARTFLAVPLIKESAVIGAVVIYRREVRPFSQKQVALLQTFADQAVIAIENVRLFNETKEALEQQKASSEVLAAISSSIADARPVFDKIAESCERLFAGRLIGINLVGEDGLLHIAAYHGPGREELERVFPLLIDRGSGSGVAITERRVAHYPDAQKGADVPAPTRRGCEATGIRSVIFAPMLWQDRGIGVIFVGREATGPFSEKEIGLLKTFADQAVIAIQNARLFREIAEKSRQLEEASRHKSQFLASMSHELRTPLNAILGFNEMILDQVYGELTEDLRAPLENMQSSGKHLLRLINNVLDLAKIEAGRMELALSDYSVQDTVASVHSTLRPLAAEKGLEFLASVPNDIPLAHGDGGRIAQCLMNLAGNSLKFTKAGKVEIAVEQKDGLLRYQVADTGIGIPAEKIGSLFTEFKQTDATIASEYGGTGLGLSITKKFIEMHGGRIWVESEPGRGSTFIFEVPLRTGAT